jgi:hypothetical protein
MLQGQKNQCSFGNKSSSYSYRILTAPMFAVVGLLIANIPTLAVTDTLANDYRACAAQLLSVGVTAQAASQGCATALRPRDLSSCVARINQQTQITSADALAACRQTRVPRDLAVCVVSISKTTQEAVNPAALTYCGRSLLPTTFAQCVVGLSKEINLTPTQALDTCIDASDRASGVGAWANTSPGLNPRLEFTPVPSTPVR